MCFQKESIRLIGIGFKSFRYPIESWFWSSMEIKGIGLVNIL